MNQNQIPNPYTNNPTAPGRRRRRPAAPVTPCSPSTLGVVPDARLAQAFLTQAFVWMFAGLLLSAAVACVVQSNAAPARLRRRTTSSSCSSPSSRSCSASAARSTGSAPRVALWPLLRLRRDARDHHRADRLGYTRRIGRDRLPERLGDVRRGGGLRRTSPSARWRRLGGILFMGLIGLLVAMVLNIFLASSAVTWIISIVGVVLFTALTAYDVQRIQSGDLAARHGSMEKAAVIGALQLYLDFINLFLFMLRLLGGRS